MNKISFTPKKIKLILKILSFLDNNIHNFLKNHKMNKLTNNINYKFIFK